MGLPLRMDNIHAPTVPSGPSSRPITNGNATALSFAELSQKKEIMEAELKALGGVLDSHGVNMETHLTTPDGFPRADIDVAQIRTTRARIIHLRNDYKDLMNAIEKHLHEHFASIQDTDDNTTPAVGVTGAGMLGDSIPQTLDEPFAKVNSVVANSPAETAGLKAGDEVRNFGYVNKANHDGLKKVAECVQGNEGQPILVRVSRRSEGTRRQELQLTLTPRRDWGGRGSQWSEALSTLACGCDVLAVFDR
ncbi:hypothetical protein BX600DRAFT_494396 [Xylariales sp. PMI_506]|nr:hypothetical protein BX600DRAFT_494396 [Xylariales sp. PMI_506]